MAVGQFVRAGSIVPQLRVERSAMGPLLFEHNSVQLGHCGHGRLFGPVGSIECLPCSFGLDAFRLTFLVVCTRGQSNASRSVNAAKSADSPATGTHFARLINKLHGFIHEMTGTPCQR